MRIQKIKNRGVLFTDNSAGWDLNVYLIMGKQYNYLIDTGLGSLSIDPVIDYIKNDGKKTVVINTHYHWDHIWGNGNFKDCTIISHSLCLELIQINWDAMLEKNHSYRNGAVELCLPNLVFDQTLYFPDDRIRLFHSPGHTPDSISILDEEEKILILGDNVGDSPEDIIPSIACEKAVYLNTLRNYKQLDFDFCLSGHCEILPKYAIGQIIEQLCAD